MYATTQMKKYDPKNITLSKKSLLFPFYVCCKARFDFYGIFFLFYMTPTLYHCIKLVYHTQYMY